MGRHEVKQKCIQAEYQVWVGSFRRCKPVVWGARWEPGCCGYQIWDETDQMGGRHSGTDWRGIHCIFYFHCSRLLCVRLRRPSSTAPPGKSSLSQTRSSHRHPLCPPASGSMEDISFTLCMKLRSPGCAVTQGEG